MSKIKLEEAVIIAFLALVIVLSQSMSFEDEVRELENYCQQVNSNAWPDYKDYGKCEEQK